MNGASLVALMPDLMTGCQKWASGKILDERMGRCRERLYRPDALTLPATLTRPYGSPTSTANPKTLGLTSTSFHW